MIMPILSVRDVDASVAFYTEKLGFTKSMTMDGPGGNTVWGIINLGSATFGLSLAEVENAGQGVSFMVYVPEATNIDDYYKDVQGRGVAVEREIKTEYWGDRTFGLKDPDGYDISLCKTVEEVDMDKITAAMQEA